MSEVKFSINGKEHIVSSNIEPDTSLNVYLRKHCNLHGTKAMCHEGGCGACIVSVTSLHPVHKMPEVFAVNSCLVSVLSCHGWAITTVEGIGDKNKGYHALQKRLADFNATQCGFCSPGMVVNMYSLQEKHGTNMTMKDVENSFAGNLCRCTGYRPILDAFKTFSKDCDTELMNKIKDIEDFAPFQMCNKSGLICAKTCNDYSEDGFCKIEMEQPLQHMILDDKPLMLKTDESMWYKVYTLKDIFDIFDKEGTKSYSLVAGNTAQGVYHVDELPKVMIDISSVAELRKYEENTSLSLGANMTLNEIMELFLKIGKMNLYFAYTLQMQHHMDLVAHIPVRNIGTLAGNLSIKHKHKEFQSDLFLLLEGVGATMTIAEKGGKKTVITLPEYLKMNMVGKVIYCVNLPPLAQEYVFQSYKIMPRAQNAHAHINAAFLFKFNSDKSVIEDVRIVYGGVSADFIHASATEKMLKGKNIFSSAVLKLALQSLSNEIFPEEAPPEPTPEYRKKLAIGLFYKCILHISPPNLVAANLKSGGEEFDRKVSSGKQDFDTKQENWPLTKPIPKLEALVQCSGEATYINDLPTMTGELYAAFVLSTVYDGNIEKIDTSSVMSIKGVVAVYTAKDIPGANNFSPTRMPFVIEPEEVLCSDKILFHGQPVAIVIAETERLANLIAAKVKVTYKNTNKNPPVLSVRDALSSSTASTRVKKQATLEPKTKGNDVKKVIKGSFDIFSQYHYHMETQSCICVPIEDGLDVYPSTQWMDMISVAISDAVHIPINNINVHVRRLGGSYGAKISRNSQVAIACALAATKLNKPVRMVLSFETNMIAIGKRLPCSHDYEVGVDDKGKIQYLKSDIYAEDGCSRNDAISFFFMEPFSNCYDNKTWYVQTNAVLTDTAANTWCRAPGTTEAVAMIENIMEHIAIEVGKDPTEVRLCNMDLEDNPLPDLIKSFKQEADFDKRAEGVIKFNSLNRWKKRGLSLIPLRYPCDYFGNFDANVSIFQGDGTVAVSHGGIEMGQGINTKVAQVCAHILKIPLETVQVKPSNNFSSPNSMVSGGSITSESCCYATMKACEILLERLEPVKKDMKSPTWAELIQKAYLAGIDLSARYMYSVLHDPLKNYSIWGITITEVEVDMITGNHQILRVDLLEDTGESMSPQVDIGQVEGAFIMGVGYWTSEHLMYDKKTGALLTNRTWTYKPPGIKDIPQDFRIKFRQNSKNATGVLRSKATGEPPLNMAFGIATAIRQAITSARAENGLPEDKWYEIVAPFTTENIILATKTDIEQFKM